MLQENVTEYNITKVDDINSQWNLLLEQFISYNLFNNSKQMELLYRIF